VPRKNLREIGGRPSIAWAIQAVIDSELFSRIVVSTDDDEIADIAECAGASVPFRRPSELGDDHASVRSVMRHALQELDTYVSEDEAICCVYPTAVLLDPSDLRRSLEAWKSQPTFASALAVTTYPHPIERAFVIDGSGQITLTDSSCVDHRTQDLGVQVHDSAQFCWASKRTWLGPASILENSLGYLIPSWRAIDIDDEDDLMHATLLHYALRYMGSTD